MAPKATKDRPVKYCDAHNNPARSNTTRKRVTRFLPNCTKTKLNRRAKYHNETPKDPNSQCIWLKLSAPFKRTENIYNIPQNLHNHYLFVTLSYFLRQNIHLLTNNNQVDPSKQCFIKIFHSLIRHELRLRFHE